MPFRLLAAAFMAALGATLGLMIARVALVPAVIPQVHENDLLLLHQVGLGIAGSLALQLVLLAQPSIRVRTGLLWGAAGFTAFILAPWLAGVGGPPGRVPGPDDGDLGLWLFALAASAAGLALLRWPGRRTPLGRLVGLALLALPVLAGAPDGTGTDLATPGYGIQAETDPVLGVWRGLGLNLLFWLLLGYFSVLAARRVVLPGAGKTDPAGPPPTG